MGKASSKLLDNSIIIAAHPDDELLWFNSILKQVDEVVIVYEDFWAHPELKEARRAVIRDYPRPNVRSLGMSESGACGCANWASPTESPFGIELSIEAQRRELTRVSKLALARIGVLDPLVSDCSVAVRYEQNFQLLLEAFRPRLSSGMNVFTHNPWGEYGHEEHVQLFRVLQTLREEIGFNLWMSNYCTERALPMAMRYFQRETEGYVRLPTDTEFADKVADLYKKHDCWTWSEDWVWFEEECFMEAPRAASEPTAHQHLFPLNFFSIEEKASRNWVPMVAGATAASAALLAASEL